MKLALQLLLAAISRQKSSFSSYFRNLKLFLQDYIKNALRGFKAR